MPLKDSQVATQSSHPDHAAKPRQDTQQRPTVPPRSPPLSPLRTIPTTLPSTKLSSSVKSPTVPSQPPSLPSKQLSSSDPVSTSLSTPTSSSSQSKHPSSQPSIEIPNGQVEQTPTPAVTPTSTSAPAKDGPSAPTSSTTKDSSRPSQQHPSDSAVVTPSPAADGGDGSDVDDGKDPIDMEIYSQILELDEDSEGFSIEMTQDYFDQAETTFQEMEDALNARDLPKLSSLGHYLKGSSAALGVVKVQRSCEQIQHYGKCRDEEKSVDLSEDQALEKIRQRVGRVKKEHAVAEQWLKNLQATS